MPAPLDFTSNLEAFLTALDSQRTQRWSLLWLDPTLQLLIVQRESPRIRCATVPEMAALNPAFRGQTWIKVASGLKVQLGLCETSDWELAVLEGLGVCLLEDPSPDAGLWLEPLFRLWEAALQACILFQQSQSHDQKSNREAIVL